MTQIKKVKTSDGVQFYPQTHTKAVIDDNGYSVESRMQAVQDVVNQAQMAIGAVPSDIYPTKGSTNWATSGGIWSELYDSTDVFINSSEVTWSAGNINSQGAIVTTYANMYTIVDIEKNVEYRLRLNNSTSFKLNTYKYVNNKWDKISKLISLTGEVTKTFTVTDSTRILFIFWDKPTAAQAQAIPLSVDIVTKKYVEHSSFDSEPTNNSTNPVTSGGVYNAIQVVQSDVTELSGEVDAYVESINDELHDKVANAETISIANTATFTTSKYIQLSDGNTTSGGSTWRCTVDYIPVGDNWWKVRIGSTGGISGAAAVAFYREDKSYISGSPCGTATTVDIPANTKYVRFSKANNSDVHTIITYSMVSKIAALDDEIDGVKEDLEANYRKKDKEENYSGSIISGVAYYGTVGSAIQSRSNASFKSVKIACEKGTMFKINATGYGNAHDITVTDSSNIILGTVDISTTAIGGVFEVPWDNAAYFYLSAGTISTIIKLPTLHDDSYIVNNTARSMYAITGSISTATDYKGIGIPFLLKKGDVVRITGKSYNNFRAYLLRSLNGTYIGSFSDTNAYLTDLYYTYMGEDDVFLHVNGYTSQDIKIEKLSKDAAMTLRWRTRKMVAMGDSITSYDASNFGEYIRGMLGCPWCSTNRPDWGNLAEGNATICNWENTTDTFTHGSASVNGTFVNRTLPNEVLQLLRHVTAEGEQITWTIKSDNSTHSIDTSVAVGAGYTSDIPNLIVIAMGTNDTNTTDDYSTVISQSYSNLTKLTICSALRWSLETLQNKFPSASIVCVTPIKRGTRTTAEMEAKCALIKKICNYMAIPVVDGYNISGYSPLSYGIYSSDQIHPNSHTQRVARSIAAQVGALA